MNEFYRYNDQTSYFSVIIELNAETSDKMQYGVIL